MIHKCHHYEVQFVQNTITNHNVYTIYTDNPITVACTLGVREIMLDILENKFDYALVIEDDVIFLENMFDHGNKWITQKIINSIFNIENPYVLYLQCNRPESIFYNKKKSAGGIIKTEIRYGEPAYITNYRACQLLLKHLFPITAAFDEYKFVVKLHYSIQQGILVPYVCNELSANHLKYKSALLNHTFERSLRKKNYSIFDILKRNFFIRTNTNNGYQRIISYLIKCINHEINISINDVNIPSDMMCYCIGNYEMLLQNNYLISASIDENTCHTMQPTFIISVRGKKSFDISKKKFDISPPIGDILLLFGHIIPKKKIPYTNIVLCITNQI